MKLTNKIKATRNNITTVSTALFMLVAGIFLPYTAHAAAGDAYFTLSPTTGSYSVGNNIVVSVSETSTSGDNTNAVQANLSYPTSLLQYQGISLDGPFTLCGQETGGGGAVNIGCASTTTVSGTSQVAQVTFSVLASGTAPVAMTSGSDIDNTSGSSVWNGTLPSASYSLSKPATTTPTTTPTTTTPTTTKSSVPVTNPTTKPTTSTPATSTPAPTTARSTPTPEAAAPSLASVSVTVVNSKGDAVKGVKVTLDKTHSALTNGNGIANFSGVASGSYTLIASKTGQKSIQSKFVLTPGENKLLRLEFASTGSSIVPIVLGITGIVIVVLVIGSVYLRIYRRRLNRPSPNSVTGDTAFTGSSSSDVTSIPVVNHMPSTIITPVPTPAAPVASETPSSSLFPSTPPPTVITPEAPVSATTPSSPNETIVTPPPQTQV